MPTWREDTDWRPRRRRPRGLERLAREALGRQAALDGGGYLAGPPRLVGDPGRLIPSLLASPSATVLAGFDFPVGVPTVYARAARVRRFRDLLDGLCAPPWEAFAAPAHTAAEISVRRPFYPAGNGVGARKQDLVTALGAAEGADLLRVCERAAPGRPAAECLLWTIGPKQVGRAALSGWTAVLRPALAAGARLWPLDGALGDLLREPVYAIAATYPADASRQLGLPPPGPTGAKRDQRYRQEAGRALIESTRSRNAVGLSPELQGALLDGFGPAPNGEDSFDAAVGLLAMLEVVVGRHPDGAPLSDEVRHVEGWILGHHTSYWRAEPS